jgi:hypothetical protein
MSELEPKLSDIDKLAIDATIKYQSSLLDLMKHTDSRAQQLIAMYTGLAGAAATVALSDWLKNSSVHAAAKLLLVGYAAMLFLGAAFAFQACRSVDLTLPSRSGDFWLWYKNNPEHGAKEFLLAAEESARKNEKLQSDSGDWLKYSMVSGQIAIAFAVMAVLAAVFKFR